ncbi:hypothetical protein M0813_08690 [Anaeramoeba flamelloides]|uniref:Uncharacterized protein n=1 Tax=Anaeramoeba flamelloides TaxID=1746091 RepID=A0AAV8A3D7_9EUKA|nr:hypothetical protein M0812_00394 [Anaeramoeba flamelloides]KAJ6228653.1 hypothetical protein M0813_08690 [Anaeramoeba flamelloides]
MTSTLDINQTKQIAEFARMVLKLRKPSRLFIQPRTKIEKTTLVLHPKKRSPNTNCLLGQNEDEKNQKISKKELTEFLNSKPQPTWNEKLKMIKKYDPSLVTNHQMLENKQKKKSSRKIIIHKKTIQLIVNMSVCQLPQFNQKVCEKKYLDSENGLSNYFRAQGFEKKKTFNNDKLIFQMYQQKYQK